MEFGFLIEQELEDVGAKVMGVFGVTDFYRDYEDTWEWVEGEKADGLKVNVSRPHNWKSGEYARPVVVNVNGEAQVLGALRMEECAAKLAKELGVEVWTGWAKNMNRPRDYTFEVEARFGAEV